MRSYAAAEGPRVIFVGKLIVSKGVDLLLAAWPLVVREHPGARLLMVGFGEYADGARAALGRARLRRSRRRPRGRPPRLGARGWGGGAAAAILSAFLADPPDGYAEAARAAAGSVDFAGRLEHGEVAARRPQQRRDGRAQHLPGGVRDGRRRGRRVRRAAGLRPSTRAWPRSPGRSPGTLPAGRRGADGVPARRRMRSSAIADRLEPLARAPEPAERAARGRCAGDAVERPAGAGRAWPAAVLAASAGELDELVPVSRRC